MPLNAHSKAALEFKSTSAGTWDVLLTLTFTTFSPHFYGAAKIDSFAGFVDGSADEKTLYVFITFSLKPREGQIQLTY